MAIAVVAGSIAARHGLRNRPADGPFSVVAPSLPNLFNYLFLAVEIMGVAFLVLLLVLSYREREAQPRRVKPRIPWWLKLFAAIFIVGFASLLSIGLGWLGFDLRPDLWLQGLGEAGLGGELDFQTSEALGLFLTVLLAMFLLSLMAGSALMVRKAVAADARDFQDPVATGAVAAARDLESIEDPREAIIACYARLRDAIGSVGIAMRSSDTPMELLRRVLAERDVSSENVTTLTSLFEKARFSTHPVDESMRDEAKAALADVTAELGAES